MLRLVHAQTLGSLLQLVPGKLPAFLAPVRHELLMAGLQLRVLRRLPTSLGAPSSGLQGSTYPGLQASTAAARLHRIHVPAGGRGAVTGHQAAAATAEALVGAWAVVAAAEATEAAALTKRGAALLGEPVLVLRRCRMQLVPHG